MTEMSHCSSRPGVLLPPGLDEQWLISVMHDDEAAMTYAAVFQEFVGELTA